MPIESPAPPRRKRVYIAGPYRNKKENGVYENIQMAREAAVRLWKWGYAPLCPHLNSAFMGGIVPDDEFLLGDLAWVEVAELVVLLPGWSESEGAKAERTFALACGIEVIEYVTLCIREMMLNGRK